jgi:hypothetical protein
MKPERAPPEPTHPLRLTHEESGILCHVMMQAMLASGGLSKQDARVLKLYEKLAAVNDKFRG